MTENTTFASETPIAGAEHVIEGGVFVDIPLDQLVPYRRQSRKVFTADAMASLTESVKARGVVQPISAKPLQDGRYEILAGERRWRAAQMAGLRTIPAIVRDDLSDQDAEVLHLVENLQREGLTLAEECEGVRQLVKDVGVTKAAAELGKSEAWVSKRAGVLDLPAPLQQLIVDEKIKDIEIAGTIAQINEFDPGRAKRLMETINQPKDWQHPVTRQSVREELKDARVRQKRLAEEERNSVANAEAEAKHQTQMGKEESARKAKERKIAKVKEDRKNLKASALASMYQSLGFDEKLQDQFDAPIRLDYVTSDFNEYGPKSKVPVTVDGCNFDFKGRGDVETLTHIVAGFGKEPLISVRVSDLTLAQAARLEAALHDLDEDELALWFDARVSGKQLSAITLRLSAIAAEGQKPEKQGELTIGTFIGEQLDRSDKRAKSKAADVYAAYAAWCKVGKIDPIAMNDNRWGEAIAATGIEKVRSNGIQYVGVKLRCQP